MSSNSIDRNFRICETYLLENTDIALLHLPGELLQLPEHPCIHVIHLRGLPCRRAQDPLQPPDPDPEPVDHFIDRLVLSNGVSVTCGRRRGWQAGHGRLWGEGVVLVPEAGADVDDGERMAVVHVVGSALRPEIAKNWREIVPSVRVYGRIYS